MILTFVFLSTLFLCILKPKYGVFGIFIFAILISNALQLGFVETNRSFTTPFSFFKLTKIDTIDKQGVRLLILVLFLSSILKKILAKKRINEYWLVKMILLIILISVSSMVLNNINIRDGFSSISLFIISLVFLSAVSNLNFKLRDIQLFLLSTLVFVLINAVFQLYQFFIYAFGDWDMTLGLLASTTPTSTFAFVVSFFFIGKVSVGRFDKSVVVSILIAIVQLVSSYFKGIIAFVIIILTSFRKLLISSKKIVIATATLLFLLFSISAFIFKNTAKDYVAFYEFENLNMLLNVGPVKVWTQYFEFLDNPKNLILGYGPSSYGSINTTNDIGFRRSKLAEMLSIRAGGNLSGRDIFGTALSSAGNILWENGIIVLFLFFLVHFKLYKISSTILKNTKNEIIKLYVFVVKYEIIFIALLYFAAFGSTTEEILLWGPAFVVFSFIKSQYKLELSKL